MEAFNASKTYVKTHKGYMVQLPKVIETFYKKSHLDRVSNATYLEMYFPQADFSMGLKGSQIKINYTEVIYSHHTRLALIQSKIHGIPFEGLDQYVHERGSMTGVIGKIFKLFSVTGREMDQAALATWLCEAILLPNSLSGIQVLWTNESENAVTAKLIKDQYEIDVTFGFNEEGLLSYAETNARYMTVERNQFKQLPWRITFEDYKIFEGLLVPRTIKCMWLLPEGEFVYFKGHDACFHYEV